MDIICQAKSGKYDLCSYYSPFFGFTIIYLNLAIIVMIKIMIMMIVMVQMATTKIILTTVIIINNDDDNDDDNNSNDNNTKIDNSMTQLSVNLSSKK